MEEIFGDQTKGTKCLKANVNFLGQAAGDVKIDSAGTLTLSTSRNNTNVALLSGTGAFNVTAGTTTQTSAGTCGSAVSTEAWSNGSTGKFNSSLNFDGSDDYIEGTAFGTSNTRGSISAWIKTTDTSGVIFSQYDTAAGTNHIGSLRIASSGKLCARFRTGLGYEECTDHTVNDGSWHLVTVTFDAGSTYTFYIDGVLVADTVADSDESALWFGSLSSLDNYSIGSWVANTARGEYLSGQIDDVQIFNYALTPSQIKTLFNENSAVRFGPQTGSP